MSTTRLPELPETDYGDCDVVTDGAFTPATVNAYGLAVWKAAIEAAAKACDSRVTNEFGCHREDYENRQCAAAIRSLPLPEQGGAAATPQERQGE